MNLDQPRYFIQPRYLAFDGLRGLAVLLVFFCHFGKFWGDKISGSVLWVGVDIFFVLSGFLITGILYDSLNEPHYFRNFYVRRSLRILPVFYGLFLAIAILTPILHLHYLRSMIAWPLFVGNLTQPFATGPAQNSTVITFVHHGLTDEISNVGVLWTLCVEEQFYLIWPTVVWLVRDRKTLMRVCAVTSVLVLIGRCFLMLFAGRQAEGDFLMYWSTYTRCDTLLVGAWVALYLRANPMSIRKLRRVSAILFWGPVSVLAVIYARHWRSVSFLWSRSTMTIGYSLIALAAAGILLRSLDDTNRLSKFFRIKPLASLGVISYGMYVYHGVLVSSWVYFQRGRPNWSFAIPFLAFGMTWVIAKLSFRYFESPFLKLKRVLAPQETSRAKDGTPVPTRLHVSEPQPETPGLS